MMHSRKTNTNTNIQVEHPYSENVKSEMLSNLKLFEFQHGATSGKFHICDKSKPKHTINKNIVPNYLWAMCIKCI
jgi:hypothetical protein